jgi:hypothetical protein
MCVHWLHVFILGLCRKVWDLWEFLFNDKFIVPLDSLGNKTSFPCQILILLSIIFVSHPDNKRLNVKRVVWLWYIKLHCVILYGHLMIDVTKYPFT